jgi:hypothetical protein
MPTQTCGQAGSGGGRCACSRRGSCCPTGSPPSRYDILKEGTIATAIALALVLIMAGVLSSPNVPPVSVQTWAKVAPADFLGTAAGELNGTALAASYGPPYNHGTAAVQQVGPVNWQTLAGVTQPIDAAQVFVLSPLSTLAATDHPVGTALARYNSATPPSSSGGLPPTATPSRRSGLPAGTR